MTGALRIGVDVGGTFTKAVAVASDPLRIRGSVAVPTTHAGETGVAEGVERALRALSEQLGDDLPLVGSVAFSTTQAMNALLEGDVGHVAVLGIGYRPSLRVARRRTRTGEIALAPGRKLTTSHHFLDATGGLDAPALEAVLDGADGAAAVAVSGAFSVDAPDDERAVVEAASRRGLLACAGHDLTGAYGLETRTVSAAVNASILPVVEQTAASTERALADAGLDVPLLVLRGDGGSMSLEAFRRRPSLTIGSAPAAGVAATLHELRLKDALVVECGGTSTNVSVIRGGRPELRTVKVMRRPTCVRAVDSWVVGAAGGSMAILKRRRIVEVGPRSAHIAGLRYGCFADPAELEGARVTLVAPRPGDPEAYACVDAAGGRFAITATCAANALRLVPQDGHAYAEPEAALLAFAALGRELGTGVETAARRLLDQALRPLASAVAEAARQYELPASVPLVALGGAGAALVPELGRMLRRGVVVPDHAEVLSAVGAAVSLVRAEVVRSAGAGVQVDALAREAEVACIEAGAAPSTVTTETVIDGDAHLVRAIATGAVALQAGAADHREAGEQELDAAAAVALGLEPADVALSLANDYYRVYSGNGSGRAAVVDRYGAVALAEQRADLVVGERDTFIADLEAAVSAASRQLGVATLLPRVTIVSGARLLDLSGAHRIEEIVASARRALEQASEPAAGVVAR